MVTGMICTAGSPHHHHAMWLTGHLGMEARTHTATLAESQYQVQWVFVRACNLMHNVFEVSQDFG